MRKNVLSVRLDCDELERFEKLQKVLGMSKSDVLRKLIFDVQNDVQVEQFEQKTDVQSGVQVEQGFKQKSDVQVGVQVEHNFEQEVRERLEKLEMNVERLLKGFEETPKSVQVEHRKSNGKKLMIGSLTKEQKVIVRVSTIRKIADILGISIGKAHALKQELCEEPDERQEKLF